MIANGIIDIQREIMNSNLPTSARTAAMAAVNSHPQGLDPIIAFYRAGAISIEWEFDQIHIHILTDEDDTPDDAMKVRFYRKYQSRQIACSTAFEAIQFIRGEMPTL